MSDPRYRLSNTTLFVLCQIALKPQPSAEIEAKRRRTLIRLGLIDVHPDPDLECDVAIATDAGLAAIEIVVSLRNHGRGKTLKLQAKEIQRLQDQRDIERSRSQKSPQGRDPGGSPIDIPPPPDPLEPTFIERLNAAGLNPLSLNPEHRRNVR